MRREIRIPLVAKACTEIFERSGRSCRTLRIASEFERRSDTVSEFKSVGRPVPSRLLPHHHFSSNQDVLLVIHDFRKGKLDIGRVHNMDREMFGSDADRLTTMSDWKGR